MNGPGQIRGRQGWSHNSQEYLSDTRLPIKRPPHFGVQNHRQEYIYKKNSLRKYQYEVKIIQ